MAFTIPDSYPATRSPSIGIGMGLVIGPAEFVGVSTANYQRFQNPILEIAATVIVPAPTVNPALPPGVVQHDIVLPPSVDGNGLEELVSVVVGDVLYLPGSPGEMEPGTFVFDEATQTLTIYSSQDDAPFVGQAIDYIAIESKRVVYTNDYRGTIPQFFKDWNVYGEVTFERSLEQSPSGSLQFFMEHGTFKPCQLPEGTPIVWDGNGYGVSAVSAGWNPVGDGLMAVTVSLQGPHDHLTDQQVRYRGGSYSVSGTGLAVGDDDPKSKVTISLSSICNRGGVKFFGPDPTIKIDKERDVRDSTTIQAEFGRSRSVESFVNLSNPSGVEFCQWFSRPTHTLSRSEVLNGADGDSETPINISYSVSGNCWNGITLAVEYLNTQLNLDDEEGGDVDEAGGRVNTTIKIRTGNGLPKTGSGEVFKPPDEAEKSVPTNAFDLGGPTREITERTYFNSTLIAQTTRRKGYLYHCGNYSSPVLRDYEWFDKETGQPAQLPENNDSTGLAFMPTTFGNSFNYQAKGKGPDAYNRWDDVANESEQYEFDSDDYLVKIIRTIQTQRRFKQESEARETLILEGQKVLLNFWVSVFGSLSEYTLNDRSISVIPWVTPDPDSEIDPNEGLNSNYQELLNGINGDLSQYDYFSVTETDTTEYELASLEGIYPDMPPREDGEPERKYVKSIRRVHRAKYETNDLGINAPDDLLTIQTGEDKDETEEITIVYPTGSTTKATYNSLRDLYVVSRSYKRSSGENFKHVYAEPSEVEEILGRPSQAQRREVFEDGNNPIEPDEAEDESNILLLNTPNNGLSAETDAIDGSVQFPSARTKSEGLAAAICDISIKNTQAVEVWSDVMVLPNRQYQCGDRVRYQGHTYRILNVSDRISVEDRNSVKRDFLRLAWGREIDLRGKVDLSEVD